MQNLVIMILSLSSFLVHAESQDELIAKYDREAEQITAQLLQELGTVLKQEMKQTGPEGAVKVCSELAPKIVNRVSIQKGWRVTRIGTRPRNPLLGSADGWEQATLSYFDKLKSDGILFKNMQFSEITDEPTGKYYRYMRPLGTKLVCTICHGEAENIPKIIKMNYPHDLATGYRQGDLRGGVSIKIPLYE